MLRARLANSAPCTKRRAHKLFRKCSHTDQRNRWTAVLVTMLLAACSQQAIERPNIAPVVPGLLDTGLSANQRGRVLLGELGIETNRRDNLGPFARNTLKSRR